MGRVLGLLPELKGYMSKKEQISKAAFGYLKEVTSAPVNEAFINADYYQRIYAWCDCLHDLH